MNFVAFKEAVARQFATMQQHPLYRTQAPKEGLWDTYLNSFPEGSNPLYRERTEHDCSCCKQFIRAVGNVVAIIDGKVVSLWDTTISGEPEYQDVADKMAFFVKSFPIDNVFTHEERTAGTDKNFEDTINGVKTWNHFFINIPAEYVKKDPGAYLGEKRSTFDVFKRGLNEITFEALDTVLELIDQNSLYKGEENRFAVSEFKKLKAQYTDDIWVWTKVSASISQAITRIRNTSIGTLLTELSEGMELEDAVKRFEAMVAPQNYKRPTALVTKAMIDKAKETVEDLGLTSSLERRYAKLPDISVNNVLFADRSARKRMEGSVFDDLASSTKDSVPRLDRIEEVSIDKFITDILPKADSIEVMMDNSHTGNLVSLIAPVDPTAQRLFKWDNGFSWSYNGDVTDSIKERVKKAGGNVSGDLCCRLAWFNFDDLDFHMQEPGGYEIYFGNRNNTSPSGGRLDVDMNAGVGSTREPVENIFYGNKRAMKEGVYQLIVHNYRKRESTNVGFEVEMDFLGDVHRFAYEKAVRDGETILVAQFRYSHDKGIEMIKSLSSSQEVKTQEVWGIQTRTFQRVNAIMLSPNHWDGQGVGNRHYFFMIDGCQNDGTARGFYNEFLNTSLESHRKVMEMVGSRMRTEESRDQLSGLGFSSTQRNSLVCRVKGSFSRIINIKF